MIHLWSIFKIIRRYIFLAKCDWTGSSDDETWSCCTVDKPCQENEGDCDNDNECAGNLVCGNNNCGGIFSSSADCCIRKITFILFLQVFSFTEFDFDLYSSSDYYYNYNYYYYNYYHYNDDNCGWALWMKSNFLTEWCEWFSNI